MISYVIAVVIILIGTGLVFYSLYKIGNIENGRKITGYAMESTKEEVNETAHKIVSSFHSPKKPPLEKEAYYKTIYEYTDEFGEKRRFVDAERTFGPVEKGTTKEFTIQLSTQKGEYSFENKKKYINYLETGLMYIGLGTFVFLLTFFT